MSESDYEKWLAVADQVEATDNPLRVPYHIAFAEAAAAADFVDQHWAPAPDRPGLSRAKARLPHATAAELRSLVRATQEAQTRVLLLVDPVVADLGERARFVRDQVEAAIEFALDDVREQADEQLAQIKEFHSQDGERSVQLAQALRDYGRLGAELKDRIVEADAEFDVSLIDEPLGLAARLSAPIAPQPAAAETEAKAALRGAPAAGLVGWPPLRSGAG